MNNLKQAFDTYVAGNLTFRLFSRSDTFPLYIAAQNQAFNAKLWWGPPESIADVVVEAEKLLTEIETNNALVLSICERDNGKWVGLIKFTKFEDTLIMSLWTHPDYWRTPAPFRCAESAIDIVLRHSAFPHIYARITKNYPTMEKMVLTNGFKWHADSQVQHSRGHTVDCNIFKLVRSDWTRKPKLAQY